MLRASRLACVGLLVGVVAGCKSSPTASVDAAIIAADATTPERCAQTAALYCERLFTCTPDVGRTTYANLEECRAEDAASCRQQGLLAGASPNALDSWVACNAALGALDCNDFRFAPVPECEPPPGTRRLHDPCIDDSQCESRFCRSAMSATSG